MITVTLTERPNDYRMVVEVILPGDSPRSVTHTGATVVEVKQAALTYQARVGWCGVAEHAACGCVEDAIRRAHPTREG